MFHHRLKGKRLWVDRDTRGFCLVPDGGWPSSDELNHGEDAGPLKDHGFVSFHPGPVFGTKGRQNEQRWAGVGAPGGEGPRGGEAKAQRYRENFLEAGYR